MISFKVVTLLLLLHLVGDFFLQSDWMALNKSKSCRALLVHAGIYSLCFLLFFGFYFAFVTFVLHAVTDAITSRITSKLWFIDLYPRPDRGADNYGAYPFYAYVEQEKRHWFFVMIGVDQFIHYVTLLATWQVF